jgi:septum site-determining protein MinD
MLVKAKIFGIISIKGGVGKTTVAANLGLALSQFDKKTLLVDADFSSPSLALHFGILKPVKTINQVFKNKITAHEAIHECSKNLDILPSALIAEKPDPYLLKEKIESLRENYDYIIIDSSPTLNDEMLATIVASDEIFVITSPDYPTLSATLHAVKTAKKQKTPIVGLILNRVHNKKFELTLQEIEEASEVQIMAVLREDLVIPEGIAETTPGLSIKPKAKISVEFMKLASSIVKEEYHDPRFWPKVRRFFINEIKKEDVNREVLRNS